MGSYLMSLNRMLLLAQQDIRKTLDCCPRLEEELPSAGPMRVVIGEDYTLLAQRVVVSSLGRFEESLGLAVVLAVRVEVKLVFGGRRGVVRAVERELLLRLGLDAGEIVRASGLGR